MEMGNLTSLAEVGVGVNLAFSLIQGVRKRLTELLGQWLEVQKEQLYTILHDYIFRNGRTNSEVVLKLDDIQDDFVNRCRWIENIFVGLASVSAMSLIYFLFEAAKTPTQEIHENWAIATLGIVIVPLLGNYLLQFIVFLYAIGKLLFRRFTCHLSTKILSNAIKAKPPK